MTEGWKDVVWRRPGDILERNDAVPSGTAAKVFAGGVEPDDICQGELGDCYLLSALSVLAEVKGSVEGLFAPDKQNDKCGVYGVRLCVRGHWQELVLDELLPCFPDQQSRGQPMFSRGKGAEIWPMLVEVRIRPCIGSSPVPNAPLACQKAWAKAFGSYQAIVSGLPGECLTTLTGAPCTFVLHGDAALWEKVYEATTNDPNFTSKRWFVVALLPLDPGYNLEELGLVAGHAYGVLDARQIKGAPGAPPVQLLQLRNPWGSFEWKGAFGPGTAEWTPDVRKQMVGVDPDAPEDGCFWMKVDDFGKYFAGVQICRASRGWKHTSEDVDALAGKVTVMTLSVHGSEPVTLDLSVHQTDRRVHRATPGFDDDSFEYLGVRIMLVHAETNEVMAHWPLTQQRDVWLEAKNLAPGKYWVLVETDYDGGPRPDASSGPDGLKVPLGASTLSNGSVELLAPHHCVGLDGALLKEAALRYMCSAAQAPADTVTYDLMFPTVARHTRKISKSYYAMRDTFCWFYENTSHKLRLTERMPLSLENMVIDGEAAGFTDATITVEPGQTKLFVIRQRKAGLPIKWSAKPEARIEEFSYE